MNVGGSNPLTRFVDGWIQGVIAAMLSGRRFICPGLLTVTSLRMKLNKTNSVLK
ncbi:MAG: hypothetical protein IIB54_14205 [Planctomycetes bacterium]|nr:hypothetical protein [Planctomycetota bacterium]